MGAARSLGERGVRPDLAHIDTWICDLDNTLYDPAHTIMDQIRERIAAYVRDYFVVDEATSHRIRYDYWKKYGTTLGGLMAEHGVDPRAYLDFVHDVDMTPLGRCDRLHAGLSALPGRRLIFTNADAPYAERILAARGLDAMFEAVFDIHAMAHRPKPAPESYAALCKAFDIVPERALFIEDSAHNLEPAKALGMTTVWVNREADGESGGACPDFVDHEITDLAGWLVQLNEREPA
jgi:putative hydrolase of the HAD superfamily